jgi:hypothetical protein
MSRNIHLDYNEILKNPEDFKKSIKNIVKNICPYENADYDYLKYTGIEYFNKIKHSDVQVGKHNNLKHFDVKVSYALIRHLAEIYPGHSIVPSGHFHYPHTGYMSWHTNSNMPGKRIYITYVDEVNRSGFKYIEDDKMIDSVDSEEITIRQFVPGGINPFWHCVYSNCNRYSFGFRVIKLGY